MIYATFASLYDELFDPEMYDEWLTFVSKTVPDKHGEVLDLACGTGRLAVKLAQAGYSVSGFDLSNEMLSLAEQHAEEANVALPLMQGDMLDLSELGTYATITCFADSLCYLPNEASLAKAFKQAKAHLQSGGQFVFDVISPYQTDVVYPGYMYNYQDEARAFIWSSYEGEVPHSVEHDLTFFIQKQDDSYEKVSELHHERTYSLETYRRLLNEAGFETVNVSANFGEAKVTETATRWFFVCR